MLGLPCILPAMREAGGIRKRCKRDNAPWQAHALTFSCFKGRAFLSPDRTRNFFATAVNLARSRHGFHVWPYAVTPEHCHLLLWPAREE